ncbi:hypothetical protein AK830_g3559 [Neonectria ditissima]|uniref:Uncharacterized protein n=1 Tax=Neonectria ditissima TaxID=78410 RepID=A0A0P7B8H1_9HYPO|nr:hypothetical protein AK830_g3559 [Neonectria ditissima]
MKVSYLFATITAWLAFASAAAIEKLPAGETEISDASKDLAKRDSGTPRHFPEPKYFQESRQYVHYDARFGNGPLKENEQRDAIRVLIQTYLATFRDLGVQTWLMHGTLLGWWWGKKASSPDLCFIVPI